MVEFRHYQFLQHSFTVPTNYHFQILADAETFDRLIKLRSRTLQQEKSNQSSSDDLRRRITHVLGAQGTAAVLNTPEILKGINAGQETKYDIEQARLRIIKFFLEKQKKENSTRSHSELTSRRGERWKAPQKTSFAPNEMTISHLAQNKFMHAIVIFAAIIFSITYLIPSFENKFSIAFPNHRVLIRTALWVFAVLVYALYMAKIWTRLSHILQELVTHKSDNADLSEQKMASYISLAFVLGVTIIASLLIFDYQSHSAAAAYEAERTKEILIDLEKAPSLWRVTPHLPERSTTEPNFMASVGPFLGTYGDFFGGVLNPILTFGTLLGLALTVLMQRTQLRDAKETAKESARVSNLQTFETTFFNLLNLHNTTVDDLQFSPNSVLLPSEEARLKIQQQQNPNTVPLIVNPLPPASGRAVFYSVVKIIHEKSKPKNIYNSMDAHIRAPQDVYRIIQEKHNDYLGHYFRNMYQVLSFVDEYAGKLSESYGIDEHLARKRYTNVLRAQLSAHELTVLFYNCGEKMVDKGEFKNLVIEYRFLEHMPVEYSYEKHELVIKGYDRSVTTEALDYMERSDSGPLPGAFGENPQIVEYLVMKRLYND